MSGPHDPNSLFGCVKKCMGLHALATRAFTTSRLLLSGDVELNPSAATILTTLMKMLRLKVFIGLSLGLEEGKTQFFTELEEVKKQQAKLAISIQELQSAVNVLKTYLLPVKEGSSDTRRRLVDVEVSLVDAHNRSRRTNLIVFGLADSENESWNEYEKNAITFFQRSARPDYYS